MRPTCSGPILVVDDDQDIREAVRDTLEDEGYRVVEASDGGEALAYLRRVGEPPGLILLDWNMAPMNGPQFMAEFARDPLFSRVRVILLTADARVQEKATPGLYAGYLKKPVDLDKLFSLCEQYCSVAH